MGSNFYTPWDTAVLYKPSSMNPALAGLDRGITYQKNVVVHCDGVITYDKGTGALAWSDVLRFHFNRADGQAILNTVAAGNITLADGEFAYVDLSETNNAVLTVAKAAISTGAASNFIAFNRLVLGYRNAASDEFYAVYLRRTWSEGGSEIFSRGGTVLSPAGAINVIVWRAPFACIVTAVKGYRVGGAGATINARRNGADNHLSSDLSLTSADTWMDGGAVQYTAYAIGDKLEIMIVSLDGSPTQVAVQVDFTK
jgi:hypothetical protein